MPKCATEGHVRWVQIILVQIIFLQNQNTHMIVPWQKFEWITNSDKSCKYINTLTQRTWPLTNIWFWCWATPCFFRLRFVLHSSYGWMKNCRMSLYISVPKNVVNKSCDEIMYCETDFEICAVFWQGLAV
jgi:hypothetical protein